MESNFIGAVWRTDATVYPINLPYQPTVGRQGQRRQGIWTYGTGASIPHTQQHVG